MTAATTQIDGPDLETREPTPADDGAVRLRFRQPVSGTGHIDAAWWPRTRDLSVELPALMGALWTAQREISRITYNLLGWDAAPRRLLIEGRTVHLGGFATSDQLTVRLHDPWGRERIDVLVLAPDTDPSVAAQAMLIAGRSGSVLRAGQILSLARKLAADTSASTV